MSIPVMEAHSDAFPSIPVCSGPFLLLYAPLIFLQNSKFALPGVMITCDRASRKKRYTFIDLFLSKIAESVDLYNVSHANTLIGTG